MFIFPAYPARYTVAPFEAFGGFALVVSLLLIGMLLLKELSSYREGEGWRRLGQALNFAIAPLLVFFLVGVGLRIIEAVR